MMALKTYIGERRKDAAKNRDLFCSTLMLNLTRSHCFGKKQGKSEYFSRTYHITCSRFQSEITRAFTLISVTRISTDTLMQKCNGVLFSFFFLLSSVQLACNLWTRWKLLLIVAICNVFIKVTVTLMGGTFHHFDGNSDGQKRLSGHFDRNYSDGEGIAWCERALRDIAFEWAGFLVFGYLYLLICAHWRSSIATFSRRFKCLSTGKGQCSIVLDLNLVWCWARDLKLGGSSVKLMICLFSSSSK